MAVVHSKRRLLNVRTVPPNLVAAAVEIQLGEDASALQFIKKLIDNRNWEPVFHRLGVEGVVVDTKAPCAILFSH